MWAVYRCQHRKHHDVLVVGEEEVVRRPGLAVEQEGEGVLEERDFPLRDDEHDRHRQERHAEDDLRRLAPTQCHQARESSASTDGGSAALVAGASAGPSSSRR